MIEEKVAAWMRKADNDLKTARDELATEAPATDTVCFHAQQCAEKYLKAFLVSRSRPFRKTHDIAELLVLCEEADAYFHELRPVEPERLTIYATDFRYPDEPHFPDPEEARECIGRAEHVREFVRGKLLDAGEGTQKEPS